MTESIVQDHDHVREAVRQRYAAAASKVAHEHASAESGLVMLPSASCCGSDASCGCGTTTQTEKGVISSDLYAIDELSDLPSAAVLASLGCGNPTALAELKAGETVLDL